MTRAHGIDTYVGEEYFRPQEATGVIDFAILKCSEGYAWEYYLHPDIYDDFYRVPIRGVYHYARSGYSVDGQLSAIVNAVDFIEADCEVHIIAIDIEKINNTMNDTFYQDCKSLIERTEKTFPDKKIVLYSNPDVYDNFLYPMMVKFGHDNWMERFDFWVAQYWYEPSPNKDPKLPTYRDNWHIWQYATNGEPWVYGTGGYTDLDVFNGTVEEMRKWLGLSEESEMNVTVKINGEVVEIESLSLDIITKEELPPEPPVEQPLYSATCTATALYIRETPGGSSLGFLYYGDEVDVYEESGDWAYHHGSKYFPNPVAGWSHRDWLLKV